MGSYNSLKSFSAKIHSLIKYLISFYFFTKSKNQADFDIDDYAKEKINKLEQELQQAIDDLKSDEEIFSDKEKEISVLKEMVNDTENKLATANRYLEAAFAKEKEQQELLLQLQIQLDNQMQQGVVQSKETNPKNDSGFFTKQPENFNVKENKSLNSRFVIIFIHGLNIFLAIIYIIFKSKNSPKCSP